MTKLIHNIYNLYTWIKLKVIIFYNIIFIYEIWKPIIFTLIFSAYIYIAYNVVIAIFFPLIVVNDLAIELYRNANGLPLTKLEELYTIQELTSLAVELGVESISDLNITLNVDTNHDPATGEELFYKIDNSILRNPTLFEVSRIIKLDKDMYNFYVPKDHPFSVWVSNHYYDHVLLDTLGRPYFLLNNEIFAGYGLEHNLEYDQIVESLKSVDPQHYGAIQTDMDTLTFIIETNEKNFNTLRILLTVTKTCLAIPIIIVGVGIVGLGSYYLYTHLPDVIQAIEGTTHWF